MNKQQIKKLWLKFVTLWNGTVLLIVLLIIWFLVLTPTALIRRILKKDFSFKKFEYEKNKRQSFLKKSSPLSSDHFKNPF